MKSILLILPYMGKWPFWFDAYLISIARNPKINWLIITDCGIPSEYPKNIIFIKTRQEDFNNKVNTFFEIDIPLTPIKICDLRPAFGDLFSEYLVGYDFWGYCDMDIIWGDIRSFVTQDDLNEYDIISSRKHNTSGHFTIFKNNDEINSLYKAIPDFKEKLGMIKLQRMDEDSLTTYLRQRLSDSQTTLKIKWDTILCNQENGRDSHQEYYLDKWFWNDGKMLELENGKPVNEVMYLHFINWKRTMKFCELKYTDQPVQFYISYNKMHYITHSSFAKGCNRVRNLFDGFYIREGRRIRRLKRKSLKKRIVNKINKTFGWK